MQNTYRANSIINKADILSALDSFCSLFNKLEHTLYRDLTIKKLDSNKLKTDYIKQNNINARHYNSLKSQLEGRVSSILELNKNYIQDINQNLKSDTIKLKIHKQNLINNKQLLVENTKLTESKIKIIQSNITKLKEKIYYTHQRISKNKKKLKICEDIKATGNPHLCFGTKKLLSKRPHKNKRFTENAKFKNEHQWKTQWQNARNQSFFLLGSKDESTGNANCQITHIEGNKFNLQVNLNPNADKYIDRVFNMEIEIFHGLDKVKQVIHNNLSKDKSLWQAISYRFYKDHQRKTWTVFVSIDKSKIKPEIITDEMRGRIGVDINKDHLSVADIDESGNLIKAFDIQLNLQGKTSNQSTDNIGVAIKQLTDYARATAKGIVIEDLDFSAKKKALQSGINENYNKMLSSFCYQKIKQIILSRSLDKGIEVYEVNPAFTSMIGRLKYQQRYKLTTHQAAAFVIARRGFSIKRERHIAFKNTNKPTCNLPVRINYKAEGLYWRALFTAFTKSKKIKQNKKSVALSKRIKPQKSLVPILEEVFS